MPSNEQAASTFTAALAAGRPAPDAARAVMEQHPSLSLVELAAALRQAGAGGRMQQPGAFVTNRTAAAAATATSIVDDATYMGQLLLGAKPAATPSEIAVALKDPRVYPDLTAAQMTAVLSKVFPAITAQQLADALSAASYPPPPPNVIAKADLADSTVKVENATFSHNGGAGYNTRYGGWMLTSPGGNLQVAFNLAALPAGDVSLTLLHCTSARWPANGYAPVNIGVNATILKANYDPAAAHLNTGADTRNYVWDKFVIPKTALVVGQNSISITLQSGYQTNYWIRVVQVDS